MIHSICFYQQGRLLDEHCQMLEQELGKLSDQYFSEPITISWTEIALGNGWTGVGKATGSNLALYVPDIPRETRTELLTDVCEVWMRVTQCNIAEIVATAVNRD